MRAAATVDPPAPTVGRLLRSWRDRRRLSQMELALEADVSTRHLSFLETGRARPSREMIVRLAEHLDVPLRERNDLLPAAGFAPVSAQTELDAGRMALVRDAVRRVLAGHDPYPALVVDRCWEMLGHPQAGLCGPISCRSRAPAGPARRATAHGARRARRPRRGGSA